MIQKPNYISSLVFKPPKMRSEIMKNRAKYILATLLSVLLGMTIFFSFYRQYNLLTGMSNYMNVTINTSIPKTLIGTIDGYNIYIENLDVDKCYFSTVTNKTVPLKEAIKTKKISIKDFDRFAISKEVTNNKKVLVYENYEIEIINNDYTIRPRTDFSISARQ